MKIVTHNDRFHADDVCAMATLRILFGEKITEVVRTRDMSHTEDADIVFDVGNIYDPKKNRFDHHQAEGAGVRENGIPYASFGLVWKKWGSQICGSQEIADLIDKKMVQPVDAGDNGVSIMVPVENFDLKEYGLHTIISAFGATWKEGDTYDKSFVEVVDMIEKILRREIKIAQDKADAIPLVEKAYATASDTRIVVLEEYYPWHETLEKYQEVLFVVSPSKEKNKWRINAVQSDLFVNRKDLPSAWAGLRDSELENVTGVKGAEFCHRNRFMCVAQSRESALELAKQALEA